MASQCSSVDSRATARGVGSINSTPVSARIESYEGVEKKCISDLRRTFCLFVTFDLLFITLLWIIELNSWFSCLVCTEVWMAVSTLVATWTCALIPAVQTQEIEESDKLHSSCATTKGYVNVNGGIEQQLKREVLEYDYHNSFFDIFILAVFRFAALILAYAVFRLRHWWAIAITTAITSGFLIAKVIISKLLSQGAFGYLLPITSFILVWIETWMLDFKVLPQEAIDENRYLTIQSISERAPLMLPGPLSDGQFYSPPESVADSDEDLEDKHDLEKPIV